MYKFEIGEIVTPSEAYWKERGQNYPAHVLRAGCLYVVKEKSSGNSYTIYNPHCGEVIYLERYLKAGEELSKEEELSKKIKYLWEKQDYFRNKLDKSLEI